MPIMTMVIDKEKVFLNAKHTEAIDLIKIMKSPYTPDSRQLIPLLEELAETYAGSDWRIKVGFKNLIDLCGRLSY